jgi:hypothetical protein
MQPGKRDIILKVKSDNDWLQGDYPGVLADP